jgi:Holliday junction resolvasome RuvABC endonuclease subunit
VRVLGIDLSLTSTGMAMIDSSNDAPPGLSFVKTDGEDGTDMARIGRIVDKVCSWAADEPDLVVLEDFALVMADRSAIFRSGQLAGIVKWELDQMGVKVRTMAPATWRKALFNDGHLRKDEVRLRVYQKFQFDHPIIDVTEAWCVARAALLAHQPPESIPAYARDCLITWLSGTTKRSRKKTRGVA